MKYLTNINGIDVSADFGEGTIYGLLIPLLEHLSAMHSEKQTRILAMLAAPPGAGKSTLVSFLEYLAKEAIPEKSFQGVGMDGFHRRQEYLLSHTANVNGRDIPMVEIKGAPATFDLDGLRNKISEVTHGNPCKWPRYDRLLHNPVDDAITIDADIVMLEGNYLLLDMEGWRELAAYADYTISLFADQDLLRKRLIARRIATGAAKDAAEKFVDFSDMANVKLCLEKTKSADLELEVTRNSITRHQMEYKDYIGSVEFSEKDGLFFGKVQGIRSLISYEGATASELIEDFHGAVDDYLALCEEEGEQPEIAYKGSLNVRLG